MPSHLDSETLQAALAGYQHQIEEIEAKMAELRGRLHPPVGTLPTPVGNRKKRRVMSASARKRIAAAQRKRWAEYKKEQEAPAKKRKLSAAGRKRIAAATKKRWADFRAKQAAGKKTA
jgi:hypothetical protein